MNKARPHCSGAGRLGLLLPAALVLALPASAMNWEGHDDHLVDFPPGIEAFSSGPEHKPLPSPACPVTWGTVKANPYEQIPLPRNDCAPQPPAPEEPKTK